MYNANCNLSLRRRLSNFASTFSTPSSLLRSSTSTSSTVSLDFPSNDRNIASACFSFSKDVKLCQICVSFFQLSYGISLQSVGGVFILEPEAICGSCSLCYQMSIVITDLSEAVNLQLALAPLLLVMIVEHDDTDFSRFTLKGLIQTMYR